MKKVLIASHVSEVYAPTYPLIRFLEKSYPEPICVLHPFKGSPLYFIKDFFATLILSFHYRNKYEIYIGVNCLNALPGLIVRVFYPSKVVIYYSADYSPKRFRSPLLSRLYRWLDEFCSLRADFNWSVSERIREVKRGFGVREDKNLLVPNGVHLMDIKERSLPEVDKDSLVFVGHLTKTRGVQDIILGLREALKFNENLTLKIIGSGPYESQLKLLVERKGLAKHISFLGRKSNKEVLELLSKYAVGLAPYNLADRYIYYGDSVKVKEYLAAGCPVIMTGVTSPARLIEEERCGVVVHNFREEFLKAIQTILGSDEKYREFRRRARGVGKTFDWDGTYTKAFVEMGI